MFIRRAINGWLVPSVLLVVLIGGLAAVAARRNGCIIREAAPRQRHRMQLYGEPSFSREVFARCSTKTMLNGALP